ncbi:hypothetical protein VTI74DRAFT_4607 [Chaetomium olivicolor]
MTTPSNGVFPPPKALRFVNNQGQPPSKRRRINAACLTCRRRKTRCAGEKPVCSTCQRNGHFCEGYTDIPERRREDRGEGSSVVPKTEPVDTVDLNNGARNHYLNGDDDDMRRRWTGKVAPPPAGFVNQAMSRVDSISNPAIPSSSRLREASNDWDQDDSSEGSGKTIGHSNMTRDTSHSEDSRSSNHRWPNQQDLYRVPYFRYFGPTAIVPGFKQMVANVYRDRRRSRGGSFSTNSPRSLLGVGMPHNHTAHHETILETLEDLPVYDVNSSGPVHPLIVSLAETFFLHLGCNYLFLRKDRFLRMLKEKRVEPILVDAVCALAARFSDQPIFANDHGGKVKRSDHGHVFAQRAKAATVDTFPCPSVAAIQACLLMAYESFGADQDSALWMYLGIAIRMAIDLGLQKMEGVKYQGESDPWYTRNWSRKSNDETDGSSENKQNEGETLSPEEQQEVEQERIDTFWAVFVLDRVISSGTGRPVTFRDDDFELSIPQPTKDPISGRFAPFPPFIELIHLYGRASDVLNNIRTADDLTEDNKQKLRQMETDLTAIYQKQPENLHFNAPNFREYVSINQGTTFILLHFWFHALVIILYQPSLLTPLHNLGSTDLPEGSPELATRRELAMSSAKTIADILAFAELIDPKSLIGNPFTSQPIYIAACAFLMESGANASQAPSRTASPSPDVKVDRFRSPAARSSSSYDIRSTKHSLLASAANQNYQRCYKSLQQLEQYWGGVGYILNALDQKSKGIWDCEAFTNEDYEGLKLSRPGSLSRLPRLEHPSSPNVPPLAYSLTGTTNSPNSNLTVMYQAQPGAAVSASLASATSVPQPPPTSVPLSAPTPPGNMIYDPIRQSLPETPPAFPTTYLQPNVSAVRYQPHPGKRRRSAHSPALGKSMLKYEAPSPCDIDQSSPRNDSNSHTHGLISGTSHAQLHHASYTQHHSGYDPMSHDRSDSSTPTNSDMSQQHPSHNHDGHNHSHDHEHDHSLDYTNSHANGYEPDFAQSGLVSGYYSYMDLTPINENLTFNSQELNFDLLGIQTDGMGGPWLELVPDVLGGLGAGVIMGGHHMG